MTQANIKFTPTTEVMELLGIDDMPMEAATQLKEAYFLWIDRTGDKGIVYKQDVGSMDAAEEARLPNWVLPMAEVSPREEDHSFYRYHLVIAGHGSASRTFEDEKVATDIAWLVQTLIGVNIKIERKSSLDTLAYSMAKATYSAALASWSKLPSSKDAFFLSETYARHSLSKEALTLAREIQRIWQIMYAGIIPISYASVDLLKKSINLGKYGDKAKALVLPFIQELAARIEERNKEGEQIG